MRKHLLIVLFFLNILILKAQEYEGDFKFGKITKEELDLKVYPKDSSANAVVIKEFGKAWIDFDHNYNYKVYFYHHYKIKIFNKKGFSAANITIPLFKQKENFDQVSKIKATTFNSAEDDKKNMNLDSKDIFTENISRYKDLKKFTLPDIQEGSVIEVSYFIESPFYWNFYEWRFQSEIPKIYTEFIAKIPANFNYNISLKGYQTLYKNESTLLRDCIRNGSGSADCSLISFAMKDVPAFIEEDFMTARSNFISSLNFELKEYRSFQGEIRKFSKEWKDVDKELKEDETFGTQIRKGRDNFWEEKLGILLANEKDTLLIARKVYEFVQNWYNWNKYYGMFCDNGIKKAYDKRSGDIADINLSLISALRYAGIDALPVILSTRENGLLIDLYPVISDFNYVIAYCNIKGKKYFLDATEKSLPFGLLPQRCLNGKGRIFNTSFKSEWIEIPNKEKSKRASFIKFVLDSDGTFKGSITNSYYGYEAFLKRKEIRGFNSEEEYVVDLDEKINKIKILNHQISNVENVDSLLKETFNVEIKGYENFDSDRVLLNPFLLNPLKENPFKSRERLYPVDFGFPLENVTIFQLEIPEGYKVISIPDKVALILPDNGGRYIYNIQLLGNKITFTNQFILNKPIYSSDEYHYLKELYNKVVQSENIDLILERNNEN